jgi:hypothetical protein
MRGKAARGDNLLKNSPWIERSTSNSAILLLVLPFGKICDSPRSRIDRCFLPIWAGPYFHF